MKRWPRPVQWLLLAMLALYVLYLLAGNIFLNTPLFEMATNRKPEKFQLHTGPAITLLPGHAVVWNVHVRGQAGHTVYVFTAGRASARLSLPALLRRELRIPRTDAHDVRAQISRVDTGIVPPPRGHGGWTVRMDQIHSDSIRSGQFGKLLVSGRASATVGFLKQLRGGPSELLPSQAHFEQARISWDSTTILDQAQIEATAQYPRHFREQAPGIAKLGLLMATVKIDGRSQALRIDTAAPQARLATLPSTARLQGELALDHGHLRPGSQLQWRLPVHAGAGAPAQGLLALQVNVAKDIRVQARLAADNPDDNQLDADLSIAGRRIPFTDLDSVLPRTSGRVQAAWTFDSLRWISDLLVRRPWFALHGGGTVQVDARLAQGQLVAGSTASVPHVGAVAEIAGIRLQGDAQARARIVEDRTPKVQVEMDIARFEAAPREAAREILFDGRDLALRFHGDAQLQQLKQGGQVSLQFRDARVPELTRYNRFIGNTQLQLLGGSGLLTGQVQLDTSGAVAHGSADLRAEGARLQVAGLALRSNARLQATLRRADIEQRQFDLQGSTLRLHNLQVGDARDASWWGQVHLRSGHLSAASPLRADAMADITLRDLGPLLDMFGERSNAPRWVLGLVDAGQVQATGQLRWQQQGQWQVDDLHAENDRLSLRGRLDLGKATQRGDLYLRWGVLGAGIELDGEQRQWHLAGARQWYESRPKLLP